MFDKLILKNALENYKANFSSQWKREKYKWKAVKCFQDNWDINSTDFAEMLTRSLSETGNLLASRNNYPAKMVEEFAKSEPKEVRAMFMALFDENNYIISRIANFRTKSDTLLEKIGKSDKSHYQDENTISTYLWLRYPDKYYIYKFGIIQDITNKLGSNINIRRGYYADNLRDFYTFYNEICTEVSQDNELISLFKSQLKEDCYPDPKYRTLTADIGFYISRWLTIDKLNEPENNSYSSKQTNYWWLVASPKIWDFTDMKVGQIESYSLFNEEGNKRRIYQNFLDAKKDDIIVCYESAPHKRIIGLAKIIEEQDCECISFEKIKDLEIPVKYEVFKNIKELENMQFIKNPQGSLFKLTSNEYNIISELIDGVKPKNHNIEYINESYTKENFLSEVFITEPDYTTITNLLKRKKNLILQGAPGVGKTFTAKRLAYSIMGQKDDERVQMIQFHQSYSYEDFIMGYRPNGNGFELKTGAFYDFCKKAQDDEKNDYFFIIDEINRGNLSKIFGELFMLIEHDKRGENHSMQLLYSNNDEEFYIPKNVHIIGMMNTADRSLAMLDYALRRRFAFYEMQPSFDNKVFKEYQKSIDNTKFNNLIEVVKSLNNAIKEDVSLGAGFRIGHSYFVIRERETITDDWLKEIVEYEIIPLLQEYWFDENTKVDNWTEKLRDSIK